MHDYIDFNANEDVICETCHKITYPYMPVDLGGCVCGPATSIAPLKENSMQYEIFEEQRANVENEGCSSDCGERKKQVSQINKQKQKKHGILDYLFGDLTEGRYAPPYVPSPKQIAFPSTVVSKKEKQSKEIVYKTVKVNMGPYRTVELQFPKVRRLPILPRHTTFFLGVFVLFCISFYHFFFPFAYFCMRVAFAK